MPATTLLDFASDCLFSWKAAAEGVAVNISHARKKYRHHWCSYASLCKSDPLLWNKSLIEKKHRCLGICCNYQEMSLSKTHLNTSFRHPGSALADIKDHPTGWKTRSHQSGRRSLHLVDPLTSRRRQTYQDYVCLDHEQLFLTCECRYR